MESGNVDASLKVRVADTCDVSDNTILAHLQSAYLYEESRQSFSYKSAVLIENVRLEEKYNAFRAKRRQEGYSEEDLKETYGFLLFDDINKAHALGETGVLTGNSTCTTLGDPLKGVYISMYSDCLALNRWYHGKSGYIVIIRLTKGRVQRVSENYTQNITPPTVGFDCHVSKELPSVSAKTSSFLAFERTQYYMYELLDDGSCETAKSPSAACPFAIVSFSYKDTKATHPSPHKISEEKSPDCHYLAWRGQLQVSTQFIEVGLRSAAVAFIPIKLPPVVKVDRAISMEHLLRVLPRAAFETCLSGEVFLGGFYLSLCELVSSDAEGNKYFSLLLQEIKEKELALPVQLSDGGFLILLHSSHFPMFNGSGSNTTEVLQAMFVFPDSRCVHRGTKSGQKTGTIPSEILQVLPALNYAESEFEKTCCDSTDELCEALVKHMQRYNPAVIKPVLELSPSSEVAIFPDQYDILPAHKHLYSSPEWTNKAWNSLRSYVRKPVSFQLELSKASETLAGEQREDLDDDVYICPSPEEAQTNSICLSSEARSDQVTDQKSPANVESSVDSSMTSIETNAHLRAGTQEDKSRDSEPLDEANDAENWTVLIKTDGMGAEDPLTPVPSDDLPAELIVSFTSAEQSVGDKSLNLINSMSTMKHDHFQISGISEDKLQRAELNCLPNESVNIKSKDSTDFIDTKPRKLRKGSSLGLRKAPKACFETLTLQAIKKSGKNSNSLRQKDKAKQLSSPSHSHWKKLRRIRWKFGKQPSKKTVRAASTGLKASVRGKSNAFQSSAGSLSKETEMCPLRKNWDLKPIVSECGRILVPHGSIDAYQINLLKDQLQRKKDENHAEKNLDGASVNSLTEVEKERDSITETAVEDTENTGQPENVASCLNKEHILVTQSDNDRTPSEEVKNNTDALSAGKIANSRSFLNKLKSVLVRGKRKKSMTDGPTKDSVHKTAPCPKKGKGDSDTETAKINDETLSGQDNVVVEGVSKMPSVDPLFAYALGLTPIEVPGVKKSDGQACQQRRVSSETKEQTIVQPQIVPTSPSAFQRRGRMKTLKKHQGVSAECVKRTWWLHFQKPACSDTENVRENTKDTVMKDKEDVDSTCSSTDALNLLADLALGASNDLVPPQPTFESTPETTEKTCELKKDVASADQESVLHALLRQPSARTIQPLESSSNHIIEDMEMVDLISKDHNYSLPLSSPLVLGLSGTPFKVSPLSGSTRLLHPHLYGNGNGKVPTSVRREDRGEVNHWTQEYLKKHFVHQKRFRHSRRFVNKDKSVQVTRQWKEPYDFHGDSKLASDPKGKGIIRALHGPWDFSIQDTVEDVRLVVHMWIGLFYSRSTPRFFHFDSDFKNPCPEKREKSGSSEMKNRRKVSKPVKSQPNVSDTDDTRESCVLNGLSLCKKDNVGLDKGSVVLDMSPRNSFTETVTSDPQIIQEKVSVSGEQKEASEKLNILQPSLGQQDASSLKYFTKAHSEITDHIYGRNQAEDDKMCIPALKTGYSDGSGMASFTRLFILPQEEMKSVSHWTENDPTASKVGSKEKMHIEGDAEVSQRTDIILVEKHKSDPPKHRKESKTGDEEVDHADESHEAQCQDGVKGPVKENPNQEGKVEPSPKMTDTVDGATSKDHNCIDCNSSENEKLSWEEPKCTQPEDDGDCFSEHEGNLIIDEDESGSDELDEKDISLKETDNDQNDQPLPIMHDSSDTVEKDCSTDSSCQTSIQDQPPQAEDSCHDLNLQKMDFTDECVLSKSAPYTTHATESVNMEAAVEESSEMDKCMTKYQKEATADKSVSCLDGSCVTQSFYHKNDSLETERTSAVMKVNSVLSNDGHEFQETESVVIQGIDDTTCQEKAFPHHSQSPALEVEKKNEEPLTKEINIKMEKTNEELGIPSNKVVVPCSSRNSVHTTHPQGKSEAVLHSQTELSFIRDTVFPNLLPEVGNTPDNYSNREKVSPLEVVFGSESDERCPTPTLDEKPVESMPCPGSDSVISKISENTSPRHFSMGSTPAEDDVLATQKVGQKSVFDCDPNPHQSHDPDLELRTLRVLQSVDKFLSTSNQKNNSCQHEIAVTKNSLDPNPKLKPIPTGRDPSHTTGTLKKKFGCLKPAVVSVSTSQELHRESPDHIIVAPLETQLEEDLGVKMHLHKTDKSLNPDSFERIDKSSTKCLKAKKTNVPNRNETSLSASNHETFSNSRRPVVAVKPSMSDKCKEDCVPKDGHSENLKGTYTIPTTVSLEQSEDFTEPNIVKQESNKLSSRGGQLSNVDVNPNMDQTKAALLDSSYHYHERNTVSSRLSVQTRKTAKKGHHQMLTCNLLENVEESKDNSVMKIKDSSKVPTSAVAADDSSAVDDSLMMEPQTSLTCTVFNTNPKRSDTFLEQVSKRCLQENPTQTSVDQENLIFSERMKQLLKRKRRTSIGQLDPQEHSSHSSPVTVDFSSLEEQEDSVDLMDAPSLDGKRIKVDMSSRRGMADSTKEKPISPEMDNLKEHDDICGVTAKCAKTYEAMMDEVFALTKVSSTPKYSRNHRSGNNVETSSPFDICDQMKQTMDESFRSHLNSVVKKSRKTKYRFYILQTSDDELFTETKAQMESDGHSATQPSEFFHGENSSSSLLIILRNEDIAEHISKVPYLLELKRTPGVQFAGVDEPDDVVNLTHQDLFMQGGFIMFDRAALGDMSLCNMKRCSDILHDLSKTGKWKWMVHYKDSRQLKENARMSAEAKEKKSFLKSCQDTGILEILPYHECDAMSRHQPDYLTCLVRLQVQNISARYPVFITDTTTDGTFARNGIFTVTVNSFLTTFPNEIFPF